MKTKFYSKTVLLITSIFLSLVIVPSITNLKADNVIYADNNNLNIILLIGDGMGFEHLIMSQWVEMGTEDMLEFQKLSIPMDVTTFAANNPITDSAAAATAMSCGIKTNRGYLGLDTSLNPVENIVEIAHSMNKSTGLVTKTTSSHATPAAFYAHHDNRYDYEIIEEQMINSGIDIIMGGGASYLSGSQLAAIESKGYTIVYDRDELLIETSSKIFGLFGDDYVDLEFDRNYTLTPSLAEMTQKTIDVLSQDEDGFFLMIEEARIDLEAHDHNTVTTVLETIALFEAIEVALNFAKSRNDTIVLVTGDHETGGLVLLGESLNSTLPSEKATEEEKRDLRIARANMLSVTWTDTYHTADNIPLYVYGDFFSILENDTTVDNTEVFNMMYSYYTDAPFTITEFSYYALLGIFPLISIFAVIIKKRKQN